MSKGGKAKDYSLLSDSLETDEMKNNVKYIPRKGVSSILKSSVTNEEDEMLEALLRGSNSKQTKQSVIAGGESLKELERLNKYVQPDENMNSIALLVDQLKKSTKENTKEKSMFDWVHQLSMKKQETTKPSLSAQQTITTQRSSPYQADQQPSIEQISTYQQQTGTYQQQIATHQQPSIQQTAVYQQPFSQQSSLSSERQQTPSFIFTSSELPGTLRPRFHNSLQPLRRSVKEWDGGPAAMNGEYFRSRSFEVCIGLSIRPEADKKKMDWEVNNATLRSFTLLGPNVLPIILNDPRDVSFCQRREFQSLILCGSHTPVNRHGLLYLRTMISQMEAILLQNSIHCQFMGISNADLVFGTQLLNVLQFVRKLVFANYLSEKVLLIGRRVNFDGIPDTSNFDTYVKFIEHTYKKQPFYTSARMV